MATSEVDRHSPARYAVSFLHIKVSIMPVAIIFLFIPFILLSNAISAKEHKIIEQKILEQSLHQYYQLNININQYWKDDSNLRVKQETERTLELMNQAMERLLNKKYPAIEYEKIRNNWFELNKLINETSFIDKGYSDVSLIASYRVFFDNVRQSMLKRYQKNPPTSDIANTLILFDRVISTYVEVNTDAFGSFIRSATDEDMDLAKLVIQIDSQLDSLKQSSSIPQADLSSIKVKWNFIRKIVAGNNAQASPFIVLLNGNKIIRILEEHY